PNPSEGDWATAGGVPTGNAAAALGCPVTIGGVSRPDHEHRVAAGAAAALGTRRARRPRRRAFFPGTVPHPWQACRARRIRRAVDEHLGEPGAVVLGNARRHGPGARAGTLGRSLPAGAGDRRAAGGGDLSCAEKRDPPAHLADFWPGRGV